ncbi:ABC transporter ATP-binding protein/permease [Amedibacillus dolichus]|uniref:ABC transporter ATP-binding protein/permease n=1 Tax=Amedibacillus dolichus TaxID=31971 RepID=A0ABT7UBX7_9FIRM|nr:ABC transporter ATP-binding protein/permease [Amedibacillus dolichus]MDM8156430.1 ABC transporter ATP-binding protein/permease [Amedibacillus dolichus]
MIDKKLIREVGSSLYHIKRNVGYQWLMLVLNILLITVITWLLAALLSGAQLSSGAIGIVIGTAVLVIVLRHYLGVLAAISSERASHAVKQQLREKIYRKLLSLGGSYHERVSTSEIVQVSVEGVDQLETYFSSYLPQFFYSMLAPVTLFVALVFVNWKAAVVLFVCVPLIPISIAAVQTFAKKLLSRYWGQYTSLGDHFLENLQGLTTLKIYQADERQQQIMNEEAEKFRRITMKVLTMQLNSITIMDLVAFGGAALGIGIAVWELHSGTITLQAALMTILLAAEFFLPMRTLGSFFHIAMNGMAASDKIFRLIELPAEKSGEQALVPMPFPITFANVSFSYDGERTVVSDLNMHLPQGSFTAIVGPSGCGKSTSAALLMGELDGYDGAICFGEQEGRTLREADRLRFITRVTHQSYLFSETVRENLRLAKKDVDDAAMWAVLEQVRLADFLRGEQGLDTMLKEQGSNFSGGQRQRLALARALLHDSPVYIFDEATSNIDVESETLIMEVIETLAKTKTVLLITHRLANVVHADQIYVMEAGAIVERGSFVQLVNGDGGFAQLWNAQQALENYGKEQEHEEKQG